MEQSTASLDERKFLLESEIRLRELSLKETEAKRTGITPTQATIAGPIIALIGGIIGAFINAQSSQTVEAEKSLTSLQIEKLKVEGNLRLEGSKQKATEALEKSKFETQLILEAIKTPSRSDAIRNLKFFVSAGFVSDPDGKIAKLSDERLPSISLPSQESASRALRATGSIWTVSEGGGSKQTCTAVSISPHHVVTASFCVVLNSKVATGIELKTGENTYPLQLIKSTDESQLALLQISSTARLENYLDHSRIREPIVGEFIYFALSLPDQSIHIRTCKVAQDTKSEREFQHDCVTGPGSAGAVLVAVSDDALLGVHYGRPSRDAKLGTAAKLKSGLPTLSVGIPALDRAAR